MKFDCKCIKRLQIVVVKGGLISERFSILQKIHYPEHYSSKEKNVHVSDLAHFWDVKNFLRLNLF